MALSQLLELSAAELAAAAEKFGPAENPPEKNSAGQKLASWKQCAGRVYACLQQNPFVHTTNSYVLAAAMNMLTV